MGILDSIFSWTFVAVFVPLCIAFGWVAVSIPNPQFNVAQWAFTIAAAVLFTRTAIWMSVENGLQDLKGVHPLVFSFFIFGCVGAAWIAGLRWVNELHPLPNNDPLPASVTATQDLRSHLIVEFVVDRVKNKHVDGHFLLKNEGPQEITVSNFIDETRNRIASEGSMEPVRNIIPGGHLIRPTGFSIPKDGVGIIASRATYNSGKGQPFTVTYQFNIRDLDLIAGRIVEPTSRDEFAGTAEPLSQMVMDGFRKPIGTIMFWFSEKLPDGSPTTLRVATEDRSLTFDPASRTVHLAMTINGKFFQLQRPLLEGKQGMHHVGATWDSSKGDVHLYVDGVEK